MPEDPHAADAVAIRLARPDELETLRQIELEAGQLFADTPHAAAVCGDATSLADFSRAQGAGQLWVAEGSEGRPLGFAFVERVGSCAHLDELDVLPSRGRRGIGAALVAAVCEWARERGFPGLTLTTYRDVPWNAPFYKKLGFVTLARERLEPAQRALFEREDQMGLRSEDRFFMRRDLR